MDDPWGSPWATTDSPAPPSSSPSKTILEPPPPAFLSTPNNLTVPSSQSPWIEDDAFGDWASPDPAQAGGASPWTWGNDAAPIEQLTPSYEPRRKSSTPKWPRSRSASPGFRAPITPSSISPGHLSPDPWANHVPSLTKDDPEPIAHLPQIPDVPPLRLEDGPLDLESHSPKQIIEEYNITDEPATLQFSEFSESIPEPAPKSLDQTDAAEPEPKPIPQAFEKDDGPSPSSASTTSHEDEELPDTRHADSPITSIEDNPLPKNLRRKPSSKVQELVEMYDGISRRTIVTPEPPSTRRSASRDPEADVTKSSTNDSKDTDSEDDEPAAGHTSSDSAEPVVEDPADDLADVSQEWEEERKSTRPDHEPFEVDLTKLDELVPEPALDDPRDAGEVSDRIITDSFTDISERKMWYRVSRHESMRKYNVGDDENYVRITWSNSTMRTETMAIVRRWMEEDSMGGRAFRGGLAGKTGGKFFGWDSTTESTPVDLDRVFGRKTKRQASMHRPTHSIGALPSLKTVPMIPGSKESTPASAQAKDNWEGLATFGWSSGAGDAKPAQETKQPERTTFKKPLPLGFSGFDNTPKSHASLPAFTSKPMIPPTPVVDTTNNNKEDVDEDEDDEWGDMVSPTTGDATDTASIPKTSWDSFSTNPLPDGGVVLPASSEGASVRNSIADGLGSGNKTTEEGKSGGRDIGGVISPAPASTAAAPADAPQSQAKPEARLAQSPASTYTFRPSSTVKRPPNISIAATPDDPPAPSEAGQDGKAGLSAGGLLDTPLTTGLETPSTAQPRNSTDEAGIVQQIVLNLPDLTYMLK
ncbi:hypothetical protein CMUS01_08550 [Colletotrichum musicola]|uniref:Glucan 4-alpha-glucosidase n=1 Tax=Colletotrichum musicola TaxID=2175873 RepID=A0A8H6KD26_9PEZI|nr:hypothetical protein CMUS01_08550 [Colletotrichum musicola]